MNPSILRIIFLIGGLLIQKSVSQLSYHMDPHRNTFTIQTPSLQQTFTRYYGHPAAGGAGSASGIGGTGVGDVDYVSGIGLANAGAGGVSGGGVSNTGGVDSGFLERFQQNKVN